MAQYEVKDIDQAVSLSASMSQSATTLGEVVAVMRKQAEEVLALDKTAHLNEQLSDYLKEAADCIAAMIPGLDDAGKQLQLIVKQAEEFADLAGKNTLGFV